uniref:Putative ring finger n=1 Tax=Culex tarsalis TaxID=7177 RepID=A0A1Q3F0F5_CULTA
MDSSTDSFEEVEESMLELVQRAEAFLSTFPSTSGGSSSRNSSFGTSISSGASSSGDIDRTVDDSMTTAGDSSLRSISSLHDSSRADYSGDVSDVSLISGSSLNSAHHSSMNTSESFGNNSSELSSVSSVQRTLSEDCILVPDVPVPVIDLCTLQVQRANRTPQNDYFIPIVDLLDDSVNEAATPGSSEFRLPVVFDDNQAGPLAEQSKVGAVLNLSRSSDGGGHEQAITLTCPICFESIFSQQAASTICGHLFCHACITKEINLRKQCPMCKRNLVRSHIHPIYCN